MEVTDVPHYYWGTPWPEPRQPYLESWLGGEYPAGRGRPQATSGWQCPGCSRCFSPAVRECSHCGPQFTLPAATGCGAPGDGGMCSCDEP